MCSLKFNLLSIVTPKIFNESDDLGGKRFGLKEHRDVVAPTVSYCHPGPSLSTLDSRTLAPVYDSGPHLNNIMLLLTLLDSLDGIPCFEAPG